MIYKLLPIAAIILVLSFLFYTPFKANVFYFIQNQTNQQIKLTSESTLSCVDPNRLTDATGEFDRSASVAMYQNSTIDYPKTSLEAQGADVSNQAVLGATNSAGDEKWIEVSLDEQKLRAWEGNKLYMEFPVSTGLFFPTPKGTFNIYWKLRYIRMTGGDPSIGTFYDLPNVPDTMFFYQGYGIHGAYWHNNFGHPMSHGCINEPLDKAHQLFEWAGPYIAPDQSSARATADNPGSRVYIH